MIEVSHLVKQYGSQAAVDDLSFTVEKGQIYGFLGPNGAGKSTTMNILTGYLAPTSGEVTIAGHNILEEPEAARKCIGYLPEIPPVYPEMTVSEYLDFAAGLKKLSKKERAGFVAEAMEMTGITEVQHRLIRNLSKGFRQRVGLAQAILGFPEIIILDEPMVGLDPKQIIEIRELIRELGKKHTVILSSHILSEISAICDQILIISHGKLVANDTPEHLINLMQGSGQLELTVKGSISAVRRSFEYSTSNPQFQMIGTASCGKKEDTEENPVDKKVFCEEQERDQNWKNQITELQVRESQEAGAVDILLQTNVGTDLREDIFYHCAQYGMPILRMQQSHVSLEDVFLELTEAEQSEKVLEKRTEEGDRFPKHWRAQMKRLEPKRKGGDEDAGNL